MITLIRAAHQVSYRNNEYTGKSTDIKPKKDTPGFNLENGDILYCMDDQTTKTQNNLTINFSSDGKTLILTNADTVNAMLGQYYGYNNT